MAEKIRPTEKKMLVLMILPCVKMAKKSFILCCTKIQIYRDMKPGKHDRDRKAINFFCPRLSFHLLFIIMCARSEKMRNQIVFAARRFADYANDILRIFVRSRDELS